MSRAYDPAELQRMVDQVRRAQDSLASSVLGDAARVAEQLGGGAAVRTAQTAAVQLSGLTLPDMFPAGRALTELARQNTALPNLVADIERQLAESATARRVAEAGIESQRVGERIAEMARSLDVSETVRRFADVSTAVSGWLRPLDFEAPQLLWVAEQAARTYANLGRFSTEIETELERIKLEFERHGAAIRDADDERSRQLSIDSAVRVIVEVVSGVETRIGDNPEQRFKFWLAILVLILRLLWDVHVGQERELARSIELAERAFVQRQQAETIARLTETIVDMRGQLASEAGDVVVQIARRGRLREGPSAKTRALVRLQAGQLAVLTARYERWDYIELLAPDRTRMGIRGWVYHRRVRRSRR